jgi:two-component system cell cycle response regulator
MDPADGDQEDITGRSPFLPAARPPAPAPLPSGAPQERKAYLVVIAGAAFGDMYRLKSDRVVLGRGERAHVRIIDDGVSREHAAIEQDARQAILVDLKSTNGTFCNGARITRQELVDGDKISIGSSSILKFTYQDQIDARFQKQLFESALRDGLTRTFNRRYFLDRLQGELRFSVRHGKSVALLFADIDHFKKINDSHGHPAGDQVLAAVARVLMTTIRTEDVLARYGGEEFAIICREIELPGAEALARRLLAAVARTTFEHGGGVIPVTISIGAVVDPSLADVQALTAAADAAMYEAKRTGRNRVCLHQPRR